MKHNGYKILNESLNNNHPLDNRVQGSFCEMPENNYHRKVMSSLHNILEETKGISEKDFSGQEELVRLSEGIVRDPNVDLIIQRFENDNLRPSYCAECIYSRLKGI